MEVPFSRNPPNLQVVPQIDPRYADMALGEAYSAYNEKAMFEDTDISKNIEDKRSAGPMMKSTSMAAMYLGKIGRLNPGTTPSDLGLEERPGTVSSGEAAGDDQTPGRIGSRRLIEDAATPAVHKPGMTPIGNIWDRRKRIPEPSEVY